MRGNGKRIITLILSLAMVLSIFSPVLALETDLDAFAAEVFQDEDLSADQDEDEQEQEDEQETEEQDDEEIQAPEPVTPEPEPLPEKRAADMDSTSTDGDELGFQLINWVFDYGQDVIAVAIDAGAAVDGGTVDEDTFAVSAVNTSPVDGATTFDGERNITAVYVNSEANVSGNRNQASGRYIIIELETGIDLDNGSASVNGATTLIYTGGSNHVLEMDYSIEQNEAYSLASGETVEAGEYVQDEVQINLIVDDFEKGEYEGQLYRLFTPEDTSAPQPLVLWLHGGGESGDNNESQLRANQGGVAWALPENQAERPAYVLAPQASERWATAAERARVKGIIDELIADGSVDPDRIYISGCSMGGAGTWYMLDDYPDLFAAAIMAPASADRTAEQLMPLRHLPIWLVHTGTDSWPGIETTYNRMSELGGNIRYTRFPGGVNYNGHTNDHHSWMPMLNNEYIEEYETDFMSWLFEQVKGESADGMIVDTAYGRMQGAAHSGDYAGITSFRGVPYAAAPVGELRFAPPADPEPWDGVRDATKYADIVMQPGSDTESEPWLSDFYADGTPAHTGDMSEDGLYLNITTSYSGTGESDHPVFIWFHGGGLNHGYSYEIEFNGEELAKKGVVVVTVGHRLNAFGYLALPQLTAEQGTSGNYGLMDQFKALDWIEENIAAFGGDADNITIGGQSGGSSKSMAMAISPYNNGRIKNVIMQSGIQHSTTYRTMEAHYQYGQRLLANLGLSADATLEELRAIEAADIIQIGNPAGAGTNSMVKDDDYIIYASVQEAIADGALDGINILGGRNYGEGSHTSTISTTEQFYNQMRSTFGDLYDESVFESMGVTDDTAKDQYRIVNTLVQNMDYRMFGNDYTAQTGGDLYVYQFGRFTPSLPEEAGTFRDQNNLWAWHSSELWYMFASLRDGVPAVRPWEEYDFQLADTMSTYWSNFMKTGNPNGDGLAYWPKTSENLGYMELGLNNEEIGVTGLEPGLDRLLAARTNQRYGYSMPGDQDEYDFQLINWVFDYGQDVIAVAIDAGAAVDGGTVDLDTFAVSARNISAYSGDVTFDGERNITAVYVNSEANVSDNQNQASGRYIIIELETGIDLDNGSASVNGATTLSYEGGFNHPLDMNYSIAQNEAYSMASGETVNAGAYVQNETQINLIVDEFAYGQEDDLIYRLFTPEDTSEPQPLVLWLHGSGERLNPGTNDNEAPIRANMGGVAWALPENQAERPAYVLVPQAQAVAPDGRWSATERATVIKVIDQMIEDGRVDANRVYVSGCSMGGTGTWNTIIDYPNYFAAAIMAPASGDIDAEILMTLRHLPIWLVHAGTDSWPGIENTYNRMTELGGIIRYTRFPGGVNYNGHTNDHHSWMPMLNNEYIEEYETDFMSWLFEQVKSEQAYTEGVTVQPDAASPTGYTATFVYRDENASSVKLTSDLFYFYTEDDEYLANPHSPEEWAKGMFPADGATKYAEDMTYQGNGYWVKTIPLPSGAFSYRYNVDGAVKNDPANRGLIHEITGEEANFSMVYMPFDADKQDLDRSVELPLADQSQAGTLAFETYTSSLGIDHPIIIYLPNGFDADRAEKYPVAYISHGGSGHERDWMNDGAIPQIMDNLIAEGRMEPTIVVTMANSFYVGDTRYNFDAEVAAMMQNDYVFPLMESKYNASPYAEDRAFAGLSAGATLTGRLYAADPLNYGYYGMWSSGNAHDVITPLIRDNLSDALLVPTVMLGVGAHDRGNNDRLVNNRALNDYMTSLGINHTYHEEPGAHDWMYWPLAFADFAENVLWQSDLTIDYDEGVTVVEDEASPTGYMAHFVYRDADAASVQVVNNYMYYNAEEGHLVPYGAWDWKDGMFAAALNNRGAATEDGEIIRDENGNIVRIAGNYIQNMTKLGDLWYTYYPIPSGGYHYQYNVDGTATADPANPPALNEASRGTTSSRNWSVAWGGFDADKQSVDHSNWLPAQGVPTGTVAYVKYTDYAGNTDADLGIYLPPTYDANRAEPYKTLYLSHGGGGTEVDWMAYGYAPNIMDNFIAQGRTEEFIIVTMNNALYNFGLTYNDDGESIGVENIIHNIVPFVEANYNVSTNPKDRALSGLSMGGKFTTRVHYAYPTAFGYYAMQSVAAEDVAEKLLEEGVPEGFGNAKLWLGAGCYDFGWNWVYDSTKDRESGGDGSSLQIYYDALAELDLFDGELELVPGAHDWFTWPTILEILVEDFLWQDDEVEVESIAINSSALTIVRKGAKFTLEAITTPTDATDKTVTWKSGNSNIAIIDEMTGEVEVVGQGMCMITATSSNGKTAVIYISAS